MLAGPTGCGKSTLLRLAAGLLQRHGHGEMGGRVEVQGCDPAKMAPSERALKVGYVTQEPSDQIVSGSVADELAFALRACHTPQAEIAQRVRDLISRFGLPADSERSPWDLSGGQQQRLVVGAALAAGARLLLLDEPLASLDSTGASELLGALREAAHDGVAILLVEHRLTPCLPRCDRLILMDKGSVLSDGSASTPPCALLRELGLVSPAVALPGVSSLKETQFTDMVQDEPAMPIARVEGLGCRFPDGLWGLQELNLELYPGERLAVLGPNGSGKSTLLRALAGELPVSQGRVIARSRRGPPGDVILVPQNPDLSLFCETVAQELAYGPGEQGLHAEGVQARVREAAQALSLQDLLDRHPQSLSRGQRLRVAVGAAQACHPHLLLLDEPTSGQDPVQIERLMSAFSEGSHADMALVFATHDQGLALRHATRLLLLHEGRLLAEGPPETLLARGLVGETAAAPCSPKRETS